MSPDASTAAKTASRATIRVWIDFVCPYCFLGERVIHAATEGLEVDVVWMPIELRPYPTPTLRPEDEYLRRLARPSLDQPVKRVLPLKTGFLEGGVCA